MIHRFRYVYDTGQKNARYIQRYRKRYTFFDTSLIHIRYINDTKNTEIGSVSRARYSAHPPPKLRFRIECVPKCIEHAFARWIQLWIHVRYGYDTQSIRYDTSYGENAPRYMGKKARRPGRRGRWRWSIEARDPGLRAHPFRACPGPHLRMQLSPHIRGSGRASRSLVSRMCRA